MLPKERGLSKFLKHIFCRRGITNVLRASRFRLNQPLKSGDDQLIGILKNVVTYEHVDFFFFSKF
jgi:hypothetical protein